MKYYNITLKLGIPNKLNLKTEKDVEDYIWKIYKEDPPDEKLISVEVKEVLNEK